jgi:hypothetical protein
MSPAAESVIYWSGMAHVHAYTPFGEYCRVCAQHWAEKVIGETA